MSQYDMLIQYPCASEIIYDPGIVFLYYEFKNNLAQK